ncbi:MAG TPA: sulfotransferase, partial [Parvularculaceae bacterium]|nr:sulfotransferase [Parvularculaceae bacterium]
ELITSNAARTPVVKSVVHRFFDDEIHDHDHLIRKFNQHNEDVIRTIPKDRLLVFEAKDGWAPLCAFLGKPVPSEPYPRVNSKEEMKPMMEAMAAKFKGRMSEAEREAAIKTAKATVHGQKP